MVDNQQQEAWDRLQRKVLFDAFAALAKNLCAPVFWRKKDGRMTNGTVTFLQTPVEVLGVTNSHVANEALSNHDGQGLQLGAARLDPSRLIAHHPTLDLATFHLSDVFLATSGHTASTLPVWPPVPPLEGEPVLFGGYPGAYRTLLPGAVDFSGTWFGAVVASVSENSVGMVLDLERSESFSPRRVPPHAELGGCSGGPVFRIVDSNGIEHLELAAIIYECSSDYEIMRAHTLKSLAEDGTFADS